MEDWPTWTRCGHPKTPENTIGRITTQCRECHHRRFKEMTPQERYDAHRVRYLPHQIEATKRKLRALQSEAERRGMRELLSDPREIDRAWERETEVAKLESNLPATMDRSAA